MVEGMPEYLALVGLSVLLDDYYTKRKQIEQAAKLRMYTPQQKATKNRELRDKLCREFLQLPD